MTTNATSRDLAENGQEGAKQAHSGARGIPVPPDPALTPTEQISPSRSIDTDKPAIDLALLALDPGARRSRAQLASGAFTTNAIETVLAYADQVERERDNLAAKLAPPLALQPGSTVRLWREVDALGGTPRSWSESDKGYCRAIDNVLAILSRRGFTEHADPLDQLAQVKAELEGVRATRHVLEDNVAQAVTRALHWANECGKARKLVAEAVPALAFVNDLAAIPDFACDGDPVPGWTRAVVEGARTLNGGAVRLYDDAARLAACEAIRRRAARGEVKDTATAEAEANGVATNPYGPLVDEVAHALGMRRAGA